MNNFLELLQQGDVIAYPTEGVYGLGCDPRNDTAIEKVLELKQRPAHKGLILIASSFEQLQEFVADVPADKLAAATATWPGPYTWIFPAANTTSKLLTGEHGSIAVRVSAHPVVQELCQAFGALVSTSANLAGKPAAMSATDIQLYFGADFPVVPGALGGANKPSTITDVMSGTIIRA